MIFGLRLVRIDGDSMAPKLPHGTFALFRRTRWIRPDDIVLVQHPVFGRIVKKVTSVSSQGITLTGLSSHSVSSLSLGPVDRRNVQGKLIVELKGSAKLRSSASLGSV